MAASTTAITPASVAPVRVIPLGPEGADLDAPGRVTDPDTTARITDVALLRGILSVLQSSAMAEQELLGQIRDQLTILNRMFLDYTGAPETIQDIANDIAAEAGSMGDSP